MNYGINNNKLKLTADFQLDIRWRIDRLDAALQRQNCLSQCGADRRRTTGCLQRRGWNLLSRRLALFTLGQRLARSKHGKGRTIRYPGGGARVFVACKLFFYLSEKNNRPTIFFYVLWKKWNIFFLSYAFTMYVNIWWFFRSTYFSSISTTIFFFCPHFQQTFFVSFVATNNLFQFFSSPPPPPRYQMVRL